MEKLESFTLPVKFNWPSLTAIGASELDVSTSARRSGANLAEQISQLLVDIRSADNEDLAVWTTQNPGVAAPPEIIGKRTLRFRNAISSMFPNKKLKTVSRVEGKHRIDFEEHGRTISLDDLSSGEKQIVFRGGFVLRDLANIQGGIVLIDEPELSLHPHWQARILGFYQNLLPPEKQSKAQLILTLSEH